MKKLLITTFFTIGLAINTQAAPIDIAIDNSYVAYTVASRTPSAYIVIGTTSTNNLASSTASGTVASTSNVLASGTASSSWSIEVDNNYSEILGLNDCKALNKRVTQRVDRINDKLDKQNKAVSNLIEKINEIKDDESVQNNASTTDTLTEEAENLNIKMQLLSTSTLKYVKSLKSIDIIKCSPNVKSVKARIAATKPLYKDILIADSDLKTYISNEVKQTLIMLKGDMPTTTTIVTSTSTVSASSTTASISTASTTREKIEEKGFWVTVKGLFK